MSNSLTKDGKTYIKISEEQSIVCNTDLAKILNIPFLENSNLEVEMDPNSRSLFI